MYDFTPSTVPGCRTPHLWLGNGRSLYDALGPDYTLIRTDPSAEPDSLLAAAAQRRLPIRLLDLDAPEVAALYPESFVLSRPDQHVAWRGNAVPADPLLLIDRIRGADARSSARE